MTIKTLIAPILLLFSATCFSQVEYRIERLKADSIFLTEIITNTVSGSPRSQKIETSVLIKSEADLKKVLEGLVSEGEKALSDFQQVRSRTEMAVQKANAAKAVMKKE